MNWLWLHAPHPAALLFIAATASFAIGVLAGILTVVSHGIHREGKRFRRERRFRERHGTWAARDAPAYFAEQAPDAVSWAARRLNGLHVRHPPSRQAQRVVTGTRR